MTTRKKILLAIANGCRTIRSIAKYLDVASSTVSNYFYFMNDTLIHRFVNGELVTWAPNKASTIQLGPRAAEIRGADGKVKDVGLVVPLGELEASFKVKGLTRGSK